MSITQMDNDGRILIPDVIRWRLDLNEGDKLAIDQLGDGTVVLKKLTGRSSLRRPTDKEVNCSE